MRRKVYYRSHWIAKLMYFFGFKYGTSIDIADYITHGYGRIDDHGWWQFWLIFYDERGL